MSSVSDIVTVALLGAAGVAGYTIWKNRNAIGGLFGGIQSGIQSGIDGIGETIGNIGSSFQAAGETIVKTIEETPIKETVDYSTNAIEKHQATTSTNALAAIVTEGVTDFIGSLSGNDEEEVKVAKAVRPITKIESDQKLANSINMELAKIAKTFPLKLYN